ncbi:MAG: hypothetical protein IPO14_11230 [Saprospiraceae bacterium]|nr:hypothetical protein [Saprospiraceae bacterium]
MNKQTNDFSKEINELNKCDLITIFFIVLSILAILFSFLAPIVFTGEQTNSRYDFSKTGDIGDTIGGLMNPFIALAGIFITFLAFYIQYRSNQIQILLFKQGLANEKEKDLNKEKLDCYYKLSLLNQDLDSIIKDIKTKADKIKEYYVKERNGTIVTNIIERSPNTEYSRILDLERFSIYKGFQYFLIHREDWVKTFSNMYNILDFLPQFFNEIYEICDKHSQDLYIKKNKVLENLMRFDTLNLDYIASKEAKNAENRNQELSLIEICNQTKTEYNNIVDACFDENKIQINEIDLQIVYDKVLGFFLENVKVYRNSNNEFDEDFKQIYECASIIRMEIRAIKSKMFEVSRNIEVGYKALIFGTGGIISYLKTLEDTKHILDSELKMVKLYNPDLFN